MHPRSAALLVVVLALTLVPPAGAQKEATVPTPGFVVVPHMKGQLAIQFASITGVWYLPATDNRVSQLRVLSSALPDAKSLTGAEADALWASLRARGEALLLVSHMGGTLAIPRAQLRAAYYSAEGGTPRLRLTYDGDPNGKTVEGEEAATLWKELQR